MSEHPVHEGMIKRMNAKKKRYEKGGVRMSLLRRGDIELEN